MSLIGVYFHGPLLHLVVFNVNNSTSIYCSANYILVAQTVQTAGTHNYVHMRKMRLHELSFNINIYDLSLMHVIPRVVGQLYQFLERVSLGLN